MRRRANRAARGFALIGILLILMMLVTALLAALGSVGDALRSSKLLRDRTLVHAATQAALHKMMSELSSVDPERLIEMTNEENVSRHDIFRSATNEPFIPEFTYPTDGPYKGAMTVRCGLVEGQRTRPAAGNDVRSSFGYVYEVQVQVRMTAEQGAGIEERSIFGIRLPEQHAHAD